MKKIVPGAIFGTIFLAVIGASAAEAAEMATSFVDVLVLDAPLGVPRRVEDAKGRGLILYNKGNEPLFVHVQAVLPQAGELRSPAVPIPDTNWIAIEPANLEVPAHGEAEAQVILSVPKEERYRHQLYQAMIWSRTQPLPGGGVALSAGLKSRLTLKTAKR